MLHDFITSNRSELISRCRAKVAKRSFPSPASAATVAPLFSPQVDDQGVPLFLSQLVDTLRCEQSTGTKPSPVSQKTPAPTDIGHGAALHGADLLRRGFTVDQVVHDYGDVCQAVTELALERKETVKTDEFRTLNRCLDNAIADAVTAYARGHDESMASESEKSSKRDAKSVEHQLQLIEMAVQVFAAIRTGAVGLDGATSRALANSLVELQEIIKQPAEIAPTRQTISLPKR